MPNGRAEIRRRQRQTQAEQQERQFESLLFGIDAEPIYSYPRTNERLYRTADTLNPPFRGQLGMVASEVFSEPDRVRINFGPSEEPIRASERVPANELSTLSEVNAEPIISETTGPVTRLTGELPVSVRTALLIDNGQPTGKKTFRVLAFRRAEHDFVHGQSGPVGLAERLPSQQVLAEVGQEHFIIGKKGNQEVLVTVSDKTDPTTQRRRLEKVIRQMTEPLKSRLQQLQRSPSGNKEAIDQINKQLAYFMKHRPVLTLAERPVADLERKMQTIETKLNGTTEQTKGFVSQGPLNMINVTRPVAINPREQGIDPDSLLTFDATGLNRPVRVVERSDRELSDDLNRILEAMTDYETIQAEDKGVTLRVPLEARILRSPLEVPPEF